MVTSGREWNERTNDYTQKKARGRDGKKGGKRKERKIEQKEKRKDCVFDGSGGTALVPPHVLCFCFSVFCSRTIVNDTLTRWQQTEFIRRSDYHHRRHFAKNKFDVLLNLNKLFSFICVLIFLFNRSNIIDGKSVFMCRIII